MSSEEHDFNKQSEKVTFGSLVNLNFEDDFSLYMYGDGYIESKIYTKRFSDLKDKYTKQDDFSNCIFMILPFHNMDSFQQQKSFIDTIKKDLDFTNKAQKFSERKSKIMDTINKLHNEVSYNLVTLERNKGQKILLVNSNFMLLHIKSMKYVCLNVQNQENLFLELVEYPNDYCYFKFTPCLELQHMRNDNFIYEEELFNIASFQAINGKNPYVVADFKADQADFDEYTDNDRILDSSKQADHENKQKEMRLISSNNQKSFVYGSIDRSKAWKLNLYCKPNLDQPTAESHQLLQIGDIVWFVLSEKKYYMSTERKQESNYESKGSKKMKARQSKRNSLFNIDNILMHKQAQFNKISQSDESKEVELMKKQIVSNYEVNFSKITNNQDDDMISLYELCTNGLWQIEDQNFLQGGALEWHKPLRIRHLISGKYLTIKNDNKLTLTKKKSNKKNDFTLFQFIPIDNLMEKYESKLKIHKDAFFRIQHYATKEWVTFTKPNESQDDQVISLKVESSPYPSTQKTLRDENTFHFRRALYEDIWETNYLLAVVPILLTIIPGIVNVATCKTKDENKQKFILFDQAYPKVIEILQSLKLFIKNEIISNGVLDKPHGIPCASRQDKFREQGNFELLCQLLFQIFPKPNEFKSLDKIPSVNLIYQDPIFLNSKDPRIQKQTWKDKTSESTDKFKRSLENHLKRKYVISYLIYDVLKVVCYKNSNNQQLFSSHLQQLSQQIGYGEFVSEAFGEIFRDNLQLLLQLHKIEFTKDPDDAEQDSLGMFSEEKEKKTENFLKIVTKKFNRFECYTKTDILHLLGQFAVYGDNTSIYINQEKIYHSISQNHTLILTNILKIKNDKKTFFIEKREKKNDEFEFIQYSLENFEKKNDKDSLVPYMHGQFELFTKLCQNRNYICSKAFEEIFPINLLLFYLSNKCISLETKSYFLRLINNIYIDREPRQIIQKPFLIKVVEVGQQDLDLNRRHVKQEDEMIIKFIQANVYGQWDDIKQIKELIYETLNFCYMRIMSRNQSLQQQEDKNEKSEKPQISFKQRLKLKEAYDQGISLNDLIFSKISYEIVRIFHIMLKFGLFTTYIKNDQLSQKTQDGTQKQLSDEQEVNQEEILQQKQLMETIFIYLMFILEYDDDYYVEIHQQQLKRKFIQNQIEQKNREKTNFMQLQQMNLVKGLGNVLKKKEKEQDTQQETQRKKQKNVEKISSQQFLVLYQTLNNILYKYTNKTYLKEKEDTSQDGNYEIKIKLEICEIINYLLNWREDFNINKFISYFESSFFPQYEKNNKIKKLITQKMQRESKKKILEELMPENFTVIGELIPKRSSVQIQEGEESQVRNFDDILQRPFSEVLFMTFYFAKNQQLKNKICNLIQRCYTQKNKLLKNIEKITVIPKSTDKNDKISQTYQKLNNKLRKVQALYSYSQSWLQIIEQNNYVEKSEENLIVTLETLKEIEQIFEECSDLEQLQLQQKVFHHLQGHECILQFLEQGLSILESNISYFDVSQIEKDSSKNIQQSSPMKDNHIFANEENGQEQEKLKGAPTKFSYKCEFINKIYQLFQCCYSILQKFCFKNLKSQKVMFRLYKKLLNNITYMNLGQVEFINSIFIDNVELSLDKTNDCYFQYIIQLIKTHSQYEGFTNFFVINLINALKRTDTLEIQKKVINYLLCDDSIIFVNPFQIGGCFSEVKNLPFYKPEPKEKNQQEAGNQNLGQPDIIQLDRKDEFYNPQEIYHVPSQILRQYKKKFICALVLCLKEDVGINFVVKSYRFLTIEKLLNLLLEESEANDKDKEETIEFRQNIAFLIKIYLQKVEKSLNQFKECGELLVRILEKEQIKLLGKHVYQESDSTYITNYLIQLVSIYCEHFMKDLVLIKITSLENQDEFQITKKMYNFAKVILFSLEKLSGNPDTDINPQTQAILLQFFHNFNIKEDEIKYPTLSQKLAEFDSKAFLDTSYVSKDQQLTEQIQTIMTEPAENEKNKDMFDKSDNREAYNYIMQQVYNSIDFLKKTTQTQKKKEVQDPTEESKIKEHVKNFQKLQQGWLKFQSLVEKNDIIQELAQEEQVLFVKNIQNIENIFSDKEQARDMEIIITKENVLEKIIKFLETWRESEAEKSTALFFIQALQYIIQNCSFEKGLEESRKKKLLVEQQSFMNSLNTTKICLRLFWNESTNDKLYMYYLLNLLIALLEGGNLEVQQTIYQIFNSDPESEKFFKQIYQILNEEINIVKKSQGKKTSIGSENDSYESMIIEKCLRVLQLFCEGHNNDMQRYLSIQKNSRLNYDMITLIITLLTSLKLFDQTYYAANQCLDTISEVVQGPCVENQIKIASTKFLEFAVDILREDERIIQYKFQKKQEEPEVQNKLELKPNNQSTPTKPHKATGFVKVAPVNNSNLSQSGLKAPLNQDHTSKQIEDGNENAFMSPKSKLEDEMNSQQEHNPILKAQSSINPNSQLISLMQDPPNDEVQNQNSPSKSIILFNQKDEGSHLDSTKYEKVISMSKVQLARIKYKSLIAINSILELNDINDKGVMNIIKRTIPIPLLMKNLCDLYEKFKKIYKGQYYKECLGYYQDEEDEKEEKIAHDEKKEVLIEYGFQLFILIQTIFDNQENTIMDREQQEIYELIKEFSQVEEDKKAGLFDNSIFSSLASIGTSLAKQTLGVMKAATQKALELAQSDEEREKRKQEQLKQQQQELFLIRKDTIKFFCENTAHIEFIRDDKVSKVYFPQLPFCKLLPKENKQDFLESIDIKNPKGKLRSVMVQSDYLIRVMKHEEVCLKLFNTNYFIGLIAKNKMLWQNLAFLTACALNIIILLSYSQYHLPNGLESTDSNYDEVVQRYRRREPRLFFNDNNTFTFQLIRILGIVNLGLSLLVVLFFFIKKAPLLLNKMWKDWYNSEEMKIIKVITFFITYLQTCQAILSDFDFMYYCAYIFVCIIGITIHPFFFGLLMLDFFRIKFLTNVVKAIWIPRTQLVLTFMVFLLVEYYFSVFAYMVLYRQIPDTDNQSLWRICLWQFDRAFKSSGSVGAFLFDENLEVSPGQYMAMAPRYKVDADGKIVIVQVLSYRFFWRFIYDQIYIFILVILIMNMVAGIIIDTFGALKDEQQEKEDKLQDYCFICNIEREKLDKAYDTQNGFLQHIKKDHYLWNYIFYKAYLDFKDRTEHTGNEMYILSSINTLDVSWFPFNKSINVVNEEEEANASQMMALDNIKKHNKILSDQLTTLTTKSKNLEEQC